MKFSHYIKRIREEGKLTQNELLNILNKYDNQFSQLDTTTISRWENNKTTPSISKQLLIIRALNKNITEYLRSLSFQPLNESDYFKVFASRTIDPYSKYIPIFKLKIHETTISDLNIWKKISTFHNEHIKMPIDIDSYIKNRKVRLKSIYNNKYDLIGHFLYGFCTITTLKKNNNMTYLDCINKHMTINSDEIKNELLVMNVLSIYSSSPQSQIINIIKLLQRIAITPKIKSLVITIQTKDIYDILSSLQHTTVISKGERVKYGGIKFGSHNYSYIRLLVRPEELLSIKEFINLLVHADYYLDKLIL
ncbi:helix-turn-helix transcriptional regulator [Vibrio rumoiensis]|uniref:helix-turn-helix transcriptional regulator n=1 Tax=Vibrio rumoiensis TaxID=76258 RepID=UPI0037479323